MSHDRDNKAGFSGKIASSQSIATASSSAGSNSPVGTTEARDLVRQGDRSKREKLLASTIFGLKTKTVAIVVGSMVMLPILAIGTATYYFGVQSIERQTILAKKANIVELAEEELVRERQLLTTLLVGSGTVALLAGAGAAFGTKKLLDRISRVLEQTARQDTTKTNLKLAEEIEQSEAHRDLLDRIVEEARIYLNCDRVLIYSLDRDRNGVVVTESVVAEYPKALGTSVADLGFEPENFKQYPNGKVQAIDDVNRTEISPYYLQHLERLKVKASLTTAIFNEDKVFGWLVAHQCRTSRCWHSAEIEFFHRLATNTGLAWDNVCLRENITRLKIEAANEIKRMQYFERAVRHIHQSNEQDVLKISVEELRQILKCDRVVAYSLGENNNAIVIAESLAAGYPRALHKTIEQSLAVFDLDRDGDVTIQAIDNIDEAKMSDRCIRQLETLEVKAYLAAPILNDNKVFGLLVAHQCRQPHHWQDEEISWISQMALQAGLALDRAAELRQSNLDLSMQLNNFSFSLDRQDSASQLLKTAVDLVREIMKLDRAMVYQFDADDNGRIVAESVIPGYPAASNYRSDDLYVARDREQYRRGTVTAIADVNLANLTEDDLEQFRLLEVKASLIVPILQDEKLFGLLIGHQCQQARSWESWEIELFAQLALQLETAIERPQLQEKLESLVLQIEPSTFSEIVKLPTKAKLNHYLDNESPQSDRPLILPSLPMGEVNIEMSESDFSAIKNTHDRDSKSEPIVGEIVGDLTSKSDSFLTHQTDRFEGDIANLSDRISQQSLYVTKSFQKLAEFAKQLSKNTRDDE